MKTTIYLVRHSEPMKKPVSLLNTDCFQIINEKGSLSINGEKKAEMLSKSEEMKNIDLVISSNYVRTISTAKYIAEQNNINLYINEDFGERKFGINSWDELPENFFQRQIEEPEFKIKNGESQIEVANRMYNALVKILNEYKGKRIVVLTHGTAIIFLLMKLCEYKNNCIYFKNKIIIDENFEFKAPELFKLEFEDFDLILIENIKI